ncbi:MAG: holo-[acyl-carrier-protein] synthase [Chloroflexi bacterium]|nr:MAG: holo-[acyl-carrier-protein] synthase [Chloroflexota bacterium]
MLYTGVDLIELGRIADSLETFGQRFTRRVYTAGELAYAQGRVPELAARFAAKEAAAKALGTGMWRQGILWTDVEIVSEASGRPSLRLHGEALALAQRLNWNEVSLSLTHSRAHAIAFVVARAG